MAGKHAADKIFEKANLPKVVTGNIADEVGFGGHRNQIYEQLRIAFPQKLDPTKLQSESLKDEESPHKFLHNFQKRWREETGEPYDANKTTEQMFMLYAKNSMPPEFVKRLDGVVGLLKMSFPLFSEHVAHHVEALRKEKKEEEEKNKRLAYKLTQLQLNELKGKGKETHV